MAPTFEWVHGENRVVLWLSQYAKGVKTCSLDEYESTVLLNRISAEMNDAQIAAMLKVISMNIVVDLDDLRKLAGELGLKRLFGLYKPIPSLTVVPNLGGVRPSPVAGPEMFYLESFACGEHCDCTNDSVFLNQRPRAKYHAPKGLLPFTRDDPQEDLTESVNEIFQHFTALFPNLQWGDVVHFPDLGRYRNDGKYIWDGERLWSLDYSNDTDEYGCVPAGFTFDECNYDPFYWVGVIDHNTIIRANTATKTFVETKPNREVTMTTETGKVFTITWHQDVYGDPDGGEINDEDISRREWDQEKKEERLVLRDLMTEAKKGVFHAWENDKVLFVL
jgi:hypothetical protein